MMRTRARSGSGSLDCAPLDSRPDASDFSSLTVTEQRFTASEDHGCFNFVFLFSYVSAFCSHSR